MNPNNFNDPNVDEDDWDSFNNLIKSANNLSLNDQSQLLFTQNPGQTDHISDFFGTNPLQDPFADQGFMRKIHPLSRSEVPAEINRLPVDSPYLEKNALYSSSIGQKFSAFPPKKKEAESSVLKLKINSKQSINFSHEDVQHMFERFGVILDVVIHPNGTIYVIFSDIRSAIQAEKLMSKADQYEDGIKFSVSLCNQVESQFAWEKYKANKLRLAELEKLKKQYAPILPINSNSSGQAQSLKYTCKYEIQIDNDKDFQVARRIIGSQGSNMKKVIQECQAKYGSSFLSKQNDFLKLRLRGRGSGFKEGTHKKESNEPLHLCVSSKHNDVYVLACQFVDELLHSIYNEYRLYCQRVGKVLTRDIKLKYVESIPTKKKKEKTKNNESKSSQGKQQLQLSKTSISFVPQEKEEEETDISVSDPRTDRKLIEELLAAFVRATQEMNFAGADAIRHQLKLLGIPLSSDATGRGKTANA